MARDERDWWYRKYIQSDEWLAKRKDYFSRHERKCSQCGAIGLRIVLHHLTYDMLGREPDHHLIPMCDTCHRVTHGSRRASRNHRAG